MFETQVEQGQYVPVSPLTQYRGTDPSSGMSYLYEVDSNGIVVKRYDELKNEWLDFKTYGPFQRPADLREPITKEEAVGILEEVKSSGLITYATDYITIGDEPGGHNFTQGMGSTQSIQAMSYEGIANAISAKKGPYVLNIRDQVSVEDLGNLKNLFKLMPRQLLADWFNFNIAEGLETGGDDGPIIKGSRRIGYGMVWAGIIDIFNEANLEYIRENNLAPWAWEEEKMKVYLTSQNKSEMEKLRAKFEEYSSQFDLRSQKIMSEFAALPKLGDVGLEISRQFAMSEFLKNGDYDSAEIVVKAYQTANQTEMKTALASPVRYDVEIEGQVFKAQN